MAVLGYICGVDWIIAVSCLASVLWKRKGKHYNNDCPFSRSVMQNMLMVQIQIIWWNCLFVKMVKCFSDSGSSTIKRSETAPKPLPKQKLTAKQSPPIPPKVLYHNILRFYLRSSLIHQLFYFISCSIKNF